VESDDLPVADVGIWVPQEKHARLRRYVDIARAARRKFLGAGKAGATYIDLFAGPGKARVRESGDTIDGSAILAFQVSKDGGSPFSEVHIADSDEESVSACEKRLKAIAAPVYAYAGRACDTVKSVANNLDARALHFAFLDPFNLEALPFEVIEGLARLKRMDMLIHVSVQDLQRNLRRYIEAADSLLDTFAPGWRGVVNSMKPGDTIRRSILNHWLGLIQKLDMQPSQGIELVAGGKNQPLYWLVLVSRSSKAHEFWDKIREVGPQRRLQL
jgi:three-Cys-motif partner protein